MPITLDDLLRMPNRERLDVMKQGTAVDADAVRNTQYLGIDLSMPKLFNLVAWKTFRKTFVDDGHGGIRGWNVRMRQTGWSGPGQPIVKRGKPVTFGHYLLAKGDGVRFPKRLNFPTYLDYWNAGNSALDVAKFTRSPLVTVNAGAHDLLLGWEVFKVGGVQLGIPDFWALQLEGPVEDVIAAPNVKALPGR